MDSIDFDEIDDELKPGNMKGVGHKILDRFRSLQTLEPTTKNTSYFQDVVEEYLPYIGWQNNTLDKDMKAFYICAWSCMDKKGVGVLKDRLEWVRRKNCLYPGQVMRLLNKK